MAGVTIKHGNTTFATLTATGSRTLKTAERYVPEDIVVEYDEPSSGITPSGSLPITANGTYDVTQYAQAVVNVPTPTPSLQNKSITANGTYTPDSGYDGFNEVTVNVNSVQSGSFTMAADSLRYTIDTSGTQSNIVLYESGQPETASGSRLKGFAVLDGVWRFGLRTNHAGTANAVGTAVSVTFADGHIAITSQSSGQTLSEGYTYTWYAW